jgi:RNA polymerase sigma factor (sigma-70 family)
MKVVRQDTDHIVSMCKLGNAEAQKQLYTRYKGTMYALVLRYIKNPADAEDVFIEAFYKVLHKIHSYTGDGSFEGWMRRIMVNESLMHLRKKSPLHLTVDIPDHGQDDIDIDEHTAHYDMETILAAIEQLPIGYRTIFNMYVIDEYKHREIAELLGISINTSKSQFLLAKKKLIDILSHNLTKTKIN